MLYINIEAKPEAKIHSLNRVFVKKNPKIKGVLIIPNPINNPIKNNSFE